MQFESEFRFDMDDSFSLCSQDMSCPSTTNSFSSASSTYDPFTPTSRRSTPHELSIDFDAACAPFSHATDLTSPSHSHSNARNGSGSGSSSSSSSSGSTGTKMFFGGLVKAEPEQMLFAGGLPSMSIKKLDGMATPDYDGMVDMGLHHHHHHHQHSPMGSVTPSRPYPLYTFSPQTTLGPASFMMTPTHSLSGSEVAESSSWSCATDSPISFFPQSHSAGKLELDGLDQQLDWHSESPLERWHLHHGGPPSPGRLRAHRKMMVHEIQRKTTELQRAQLRGSRKPSLASVPVPGSGPADGTAAVDVVRRAMCKCDYPGCHKAFRRNEHLKRHKQTFHGEGPNRFSCEFCGKDQFNRQDNLNNHRKLHVRPNSRNRGVEFIPAAVPVIEQEERSRKRRAPPKSKTAEKRGDGY